MTPREAALRERVARACDAANAKLRAYLRERERAAYREYEAEKKKAAVSGRGLNLRKCATLEERVRGDDKT
jgi:hypothetical protein